MPINSHVKLVENILDITSLDQQATRNGYGAGLVQAADENPNVMTFQ